MQKGPQTWWHRFASHWRGLVACAAALLVVAGAGWTVREYAERFVTKANLAAHDASCGGAGKDALPLAQQTSAELALAKGRLSALEKTVGELSGELREINADIRRATIGKLANPIRSTR